MRNEVITDSERMRVIQYDFVLNKHYERHTLTYIPRNSRGELCPDGSIFCELKDGIWRVNSMNYQKLGEFTKREELTKWAKFHFKKLLN